jgi:Uncharacterized protein conserved in bacteria
MTTSSHIPPITEDDIAQFLTQTPGFFERHAEVLASVQITSPHGARAVSLQERQAEMLREKIKGLELRIMEMVRHSHENAAIAAKVHQWTGALLQVRDPMDLPQPWWTACKPCSMCRRLPCACGVWRGRILTPISPRAPARIRGPLPPR